MLNTIITGCGVGLLSVLTALPVNAKETATLVLSNDVARINLSGQQGRGTPSGQIATLVLSSGERPSGDLVELDARGYTLRVNGQDRIFPANTVAAIEYVAPRLPAAVQSRVDAGESLIVMRTGQVIPGRLVDIGGNQPKRLTLDTPSGQRVFLSNTVAQIYLFPFNIGAQPSANLEEADHNPSWAERYMSWTEAGFTSLDHNRDRRITSNEWHYARETFLRADRNRDGALDRTEFLGADMDDDRGDQFDDLDVNRNGRIERTEWHASNAAFVWLDQDGDGLISRSEMTGDELATSPKDQFASLDSDGNGTIARDEWHWSLGSFNQWDLNRDGVLTRQEFGAAADSANTSTLRPQVVHVNSRQEWTDSGINVRAGDVVTFTSQGTIRMSPDENDVATPAGSWTSRRASRAPVDAVAGALIARIGDAAPFLVGDRRSMSAPVGGRLYLGVNDDHLPDNTGEFQVTVAIQGRR